MLAHNLCDSLCLTDINPEAVKIARQTVKENGLEDLVSVYLSDGLKKIPKSEKWDLVVSNPPHFGGSAKEWKWDKRIFDPDWKIHKDFYKMVPRFLNKGGSVIFVENEIGSNAAQWKKEATRNRLKWVESFKVGRIHGIVRQARTVFHTVQRVDSNKMNKQMGGTTDMIKRAPKTLYYVCDYIMSDPFYFVWSKKK